MSLNFIFKLPHAHLSADRERPIIVPDCDESILWAFQMFFYLIEL
jgi:hypothetical protein